MPKRDSRGQQVKTFKHSEPQPDLTYKQVIGKVYFDAKSGNFVIYTPEHITMLAGALVEARDFGLSSSRSFIRGQVIGQTLGAVLEHHQTILSRYAGLMQAEQRTKVIYLSYKSALTWREGHSQTYRKSDRGNNHSWDMAAPGLSLTYEILYQAGDRLYQEIPHSGVGDDQAKTFYQYKGPAKGAILIPWTEEREQFFAGVVAKLEELIMRIDIFTHDLAGNLDLAIADMRRQLALPAPALTGAAE